MAHWSHLKLILTSLASVRKHTQRLDISQSNEWWNWPFLTTNLHVQVKRGRASWTSSCWPPLHLLTLYEWSDRSGQKVDEQREKQEMKGGVWWGFWAEAEALAQKAIMDEQASVNIRSLDLTWMFDLFIFTAHHGGEEAATGCSLLPCSGDVAFTHR